MAGIICLDFDDTILLNNLSRAIFDAFGDDSVADLERAYHRGEMTVEEYNIAAFATITAPAAEIADFARATAQPREGLSALLGWAEWNGWRTAIVSSCFDLALDPVLDQLDVGRIARHCARARFAYRWQLRYLSPRGIEIRDGFKLSYVEAMRAAGDTVVYIGDGQSDVEAAREAATVFARSTLWETLRDEHERIYPFETFHDVVTVLDREGQAWLASSSSTTAEAGS